MDNTKLKSRMGGKVQELQTSVGTIPEPSLAPAASNYIALTSKPRFLKYSTRLLSSLTPLSSVVTRITLEKATGKSGKPYALFNFEAASILSSEEAARPAVHGDGERRRTGAGAGRSGLTYVDDVYGIQKEGVNTQVSHN